MLMMMSLMISRHLALSWCVEASDAKNSLSLGGRCSAKCWASLATLWWGCSAVCWASLASEPIAFSARSSAECWASLAVPVGVSSACCRVPLAGVAKFSSLLWWALLGGVLGFVCYGSTKSKEVR